MKTCSSCKEDKPLDQFEPDKRYRSGFRSQCTLCNRTGKIESVLRNSLQRLYGMSIAEYNQIVEAQGNLCAICRKPETRTTRPKAKVPLGFAPRLSVDHDHTTGQIRGLLCHRCNVGLGNFQDSPELLLAAYEYLRKVDDVGT